MICTVKYDENLIKLIVETSRSFGIDIATSCQLNDVDASQVKDLVKHISKQFDLQKIGIEEKKEELLKRSVSRSIKGKICGLKDELAAITDFVSSAGNDILLVIGRANSGKTTMIRKAISDEIGKGEEFYHEFIDDLDEFLQKKRYLQRYPFKMLYVIENVEEFKLRAAKKRAFSLMLKSKDRRGKIIITARKLTDEEKKLYPKIVEIEIMPFDTVYSFFLENEPKLLENISKETARDAYEKSSKSFYQFYRWLSKKDDEIDARPDKFKLLATITAGVYKNENRNDVYNSLSVIDDDDEDSVNTISYFNELESYLVENIYNFFDPREPRYMHNLQILDYIRRNRFAIEDDTEKIKKLIAFGMLPITDPVRKGRQVMLPYNYSYMQWKEKKNAESK